MSSLDVSGLVGSEAARVTVLFAEVERLSMAGKTLSAGRVAETGHHRSAGFDTAQKWLADRTKSTVWEAAKTVETARHVADEALAPTRSALVAGALTATWLLAVTDDQHVLLSDGGEQRGLHQGSAIHQPTTGPVGDTPYARRKRLEIGRHRSVCAARRRRGTPNFGPRTRGRRQGPWAPWT